MKKRANRLIAAILVFAMMLGAVGYNTNTMISASASEEPQEETVQLQSEIQEEQTEETRQTEQETVQETEKEAAVPAAEETEGKQETEPETLQESAVLGAEETVPSEGILLREEIRGADGRVICTVTADVPEGAFADNVKGAEIKMELSAVDSEVQKNIHKMMKQNLSEHSYVGDSLLYKVDWKVNGEAADPAQMIKVTFEPVDFEVREDSNKVKAFSITEEDAKENNIEGFYSIISETDFMEIQNELGRNDSIEENMTSNAELDELGMVKSMYLKTFGSKIYGFYVNQTSSEKEFAQEIDGVTVKLKAKAGTFHTEADQVTMQVKQLTDEQRTEIEKQLQEQAAAEGKRLEKFVGYDITLWAGEKEIQPQIPVEVVFEDAQLHAGTAAASKGYQLDEDNQVKDIQGGADADGNAKVEAEHFTPTGAATFVNADAPGIVSDRDGVITSVQVDGQEVTGAILAGSTVTVSGSYTNQTGAKLGDNKHPWYLYVNGMQGRLTGSNYAWVLNGKQMVALNNKSIAYFTYEFRIPEDEQGGQYSLQFKFKTAEGTNNSTGILAEPGVSYTVQPLTGVRVLRGKDNGSDIGEKILKAAYDLRNYSAVSSEYTYDLQVKSNGVIVEPENYTVTWPIPLPGAGDRLTMRAKDSKTAEVQIVFKESANVDAPYELILKITDTASQKESSATVKMEAARLDEIVPVGLIRNGELDLLYYGNVEKDDRVPFSNAKELKALLENSSKEKAREIWERYRYDLYDPNCFVGDPTCKKPGGKKTAYNYGDYGTLNLKDNKYSNPYPMFQDDLLAYPKDDGNTPFHAVIEGKINPLKTSLGDDGINYDNYFQNLKKTAGPDKGDENTEREYKVELSAETNPKVAAPKLYIFQIQTSWQMFDLLHANATEKNPGILTAPQGMAVGSCSNNTKMANLYDIKQALIRFAEYMKEHDDGSTMFAITNVQHATTPSMINGRYFSNDMDDVIDGLINWDTFGDCEHVHYSSEAMNQAIQNIELITEEWADQSGTHIGGKAEKTVVIIGGTTENTDGTNGYKIPLKDTGVADQKTNTRNPILDHVYGIRTNKGTNVNGLKNKYGQDVTSWLDIDDNQELFKQEGNGFFEAPSEDDIYQALIDMVNKNGQSNVGVNDKAAVEAVKLTDTIQKEFFVKENGVKVYYGSTGTDGNEQLTELKENEYSIQIIPNADGSTQVDVTYNKVVGKKRLVVQIDVGAREDYLGSNNVFTNVNDSDAAPKIVSFTHTTDAGTKTYGPVHFEQTPQVHVPLKVDVPDGQRITVPADTEVPLKELAKDNSGDSLTKTIEDLIDNYPQTNGTLTYQWVRVDENGRTESVGKPETALITDGTGNPPKIPDVTYTTKTDDYGKTIEFALQVTFTPEDTVGLAGNPNVTLVKPKTDAGKVVITVTDKINGMLTVVKEIVMPDGETLPKEEEGKQFLLSLSGKTAPPEGQQYDTSFYLGIGAKNQITTEIPYGTYKLQETVPMEYEYQGAVIQILDPLGKVLEEKTITEKGIPITVSDKTANMKVIVKNSFDHKGYFHDDDDAPNNFAKGKIVPKDYTVTINGKSGDQYPKNPVDIVLVLDVSGSMKTSMGDSTRLEMLKTSANKFLEDLGTVVADNSRIGIVCYASKVNGNYYALSNGTINGATAKIDSITQVDGIMGGTLGLGEGTSTDEAMLAAYYMLKANPAADNRQQNVVLFTDGIPGPRLFAHVLDNVGNPNYSMGMLMYNDDAQRDQSDVSMTQPVTNSGNPFRIMSESVNISNIIRGEKGTTVKTDHVTYGGSVKPGLGTQIPYHGVTLKDAKKGWLGSSAVNTVSNWGMRKYVPISNDWGGGDDTLDSTYDWLTQTASSTQVQNFYDSEKAGKYVRTGAGLGAKVYAIGVFEDGKDDYAKPKYKEYVDTFLNDVSDEAFIAQDAAQLAESFKKIFEQVGRNDAYAELTVPAGVTVKDFAGAEVTPQADGSQILTWGPEQVKTPWTFTKKVVLGAKGIDLQSALKLRFYYKKDGKIIVFTEEEVAWNFTLGTQTRTGALPDQEIQDRRKRR